MRTSGIKLGVQASNNRYLRIEQAIASLREETGQGFSDVAKRLTRLTDEVRSVHSEVIFQANQIINAQQETFQNALRLA